MRPEVRPIPDAFLTNSRGSWCFPPFQRAFTTGLWIQGGDVQRLDNHGSAFAKIINDSLRTGLELEPQRSSIT